MPSSQPSSPQTVLKYYQVRVLFPSHQEKSPSSPKRKKERTTLWNLNPVIRASSAPSSPLLIKSTRAPLIQAGSKGYSGHFDLILRNGAGLPYIRKPKIENDQVKWEDLPSELWIEIFSFFDKGSMILIASEVCSWWYQLIKKHEDLIWHRVCIRQWRTDEETQRCVSSWKEAWTINYGSWTKDCVKSTADKISRCTDSILYLYNRNLPALPGTLFTLNKLESLNLCGNSMTCLPPQIGNLTNLQVLVLSNNRLESIPSEISKLTKLRELYLSYNNLSSIPSSIGSLINLTDLGLGHNKLRSLPEELSQLRNLRYLNISNDQLDEVPASFSQLSNLQELRLTEKQAEKVKGVLQQLSHVQFYT